MSKLNKYPQNILLFVILLFLCAGVIFFMKEYNTFIFASIEPEKTNKTSISSEAKFNLKNVLVFGSKIKPLTVQELNGTSSINFDLINGDLKINSIDIQGKQIRINQIKKTITINSIKLDPMYSSIGKVNLKNGKIDLSIGVMIEMSLDKNTKRERISFTFPMSGNLDKKSGTLNLTGEVTIPPEKLTAPIPVEILVNAKSS